MNMQEKDMEILKNEILETEQNFAKMVSEEGMYKAFVAFADEDAVILRNDSLIMGKRAIHLFYQNRNYKTLSWKPDFIEVAASGDLAYTFGHYTFSFMDTIGHPQENRGVFHTIWKKQANGNWKFVWD